MTARKKHPYATFILVYAALRDAVSVLRAIPYYFSDRQYKSYPDHRDFRRLKALYTTERELPFSDDKNSGCPLYPDDRWPPAFVSEARAKAAFSGGPAEFPPPDIFPAAADNFDRHKAARCLRITATLQMSLQKPGLIISGKKNVVFPVEKHRTASGMPR